MTQIQHYNDDNVIIDDACGLNSLMDNFDVQACDLWKGNVTTKREIYIEHVPSLAVSHKLPPLAT